MRRNLNKLLGLVISAGLFGYLVLTPKELAWQQPKERGIELPAEFYAEFSDIKFEFNKCELFENLGPNPFYAFDDECCPPSEYEFFTEYTRMYISVSRPAS